MLAPMGTEMGPPASTVGEAGRRHALAHPTHIALTDADGQMTYAQLDRAVDTLCTKLHRAGVARGDTVAALLPNGIAYVVLLLAVARAGATFAPMNARLTPRELAATLAVARPRLMFAAVERMEVAIAALQSVASCTRVLADPLDWPGDGPAGEQPAADACVTADDAALLLFTSGTSGTPKGVLGTHRARMQWVRDAAGEYGLSSDDVYVAAMPQTHSAGLTFTLMHLEAGARLELLPRFDAADLLDRLAGGQATSLLAVPSMLALLLQEAQQRPVWRRPATLRRIVSCGAPFPPALKLRVAALLCESVYEYYGCTECSGMTLLRPQDLPHRAASVGRAFGAVRIRIVDEQGHDCPPGQTGEVWAVNPYGMSGYKDRPQESAAAFTDDWYRTGDLGWLDAQAYLHLAGRRDDMLVTGGFNVQPQEVEEVLCLHDAVHDAAVTGESDAVWGQVLVAHLVPRPDAVLDTQRLRAHCESMLAPYKVPRRWRVLPRLPRNAAGKLMRAQLRACDISAETDGTGNRGFVTSAQPEAAHGGMTP